MYIVCNITQKQHVEQAYVPTQTYSCKKINVKQIIKSPQKKKKL